MDAELKPRVLYRRDEIAAAVQRLAGDIGRDYRGKCPLLIGVLKGSFMFMADLVRQLGIPLQMDFIWISSYGRGTESSGEVRMVQCLSTEVRGQDVLIIEDIVDTGLAASFLLDYLRQMGPASLRLCALLDKPSRRQLPVTIDYLGLTVPNKFIVGYGLDWDEKFRYMPDICTLEGVE